MLVKLDGKDTETVVNAQINNARNLPQQLYKSLTWDRGKEMADHKRFTLATDIQVYFCDPHNPWQRGWNENTNGLLRQYFPKGLDLSTYSQDQLDDVARRLNERPRKTLNYRHLPNDFSRLLRRPVESAVESGGREPARSVHIKYDLTDSRNSRGRHDSANVFLPIAQELASSSRHE
jgi:IS30 family transposase